MVRQKSQHSSKTRGKDRVYTLEVFLQSGPVSRKFVKKTPVVSRTFEVRGDQTLQDLHDAIFDAFGRDEEHMYEFQFGKRPMDSSGPRYVLPRAYEVSQAEEWPAAGRVDSTTLDSLGLKERDCFGYWFDFGDDWWHQVNVNGVKDGAPDGTYPKLIRRVGKSPPQHVDWEKEGK